MLIQNDSRLALITYHHHIETQAYQCRSGAAVTSLFHILHKITATKVEILSTIFSHTKLHDRTLSSANVAPAFHDLMAATLVLLVLGKLRCGIQTGWTLLV